jgi:hypothetical protein
MDWSMAGMPPAFQEAAGASEDASPALPVGPDFDLGRNTVSVSKTLEWRKGEWRFEETKRQRSQRLIKLQDRGANPAWHTDMSHCL